MERSSERWPVTGMMSGTAGLAVYASAYAGDVPVPQSALALVLTAITVLLCANALSSPWQLGDLTTIVVLWVAIAALSFIARGVMTHRDVEARWAAEADRPVKRAGIEARYASRILALEAQLGALHVSRRAELSGHGQSGKPREGPVARDFAAQIEHVASRLRAESAARDRALERFDMLSLEDFVAAYGLPPISREDERHSIDLLAIAVGTFLSFALVGAKLYRSVPVVVAVVGTVAISRVGRWGLRRLTRSDERQVEAIAREQPPYLEAFWGARDALERDRAEIERVEKEQEKAGNAGEEAKGSASAKERDDLLHRQKVNTHTLQECEVQIATRKDSTIGYATTIIEAQRIDRKQTLISIHRVEQLVARARERSNT